MGNTGRSHLKNRRPKRAIYNTLYIETRQYNRQITEAIAKSFNRGGRFSPLFTASSLKKKHFQIQVIMEDLRFVGIYVDWLFLQLHHWSFTFIKIIWNPAVTWPQLYFHWSTVINWLYRSSYKSAYTLCDITKGRFRPLVLAHTFWKAITRSKEWLNFGDFRVTHRALMEKIKPTLLKWIS